MNNELHDSIYELLDKNGEMGVNQLAKALSIPLSTMQKYLDKQQSYFRKTSSRKWDLPERVNESDLGGMNGNVATIIDSQLVGLNATFDLLNQQIKSVLNLTATLKPITQPPVARSAQVPKEYTELHEMIDTLKKALKQHKDKIPEDYTDLINNMDITYLAVRKGADYLHDTLSTSIASLILGESETLEESVLKVIEEYQKKS